MRVFITGGTGVIGRELVKKLVARGDQPVVLSRRTDEVRRKPEMRSVLFVQGDPTEAGPWQSEVDGCDAVVNLAGHNLFAERWSPEVKRKIRDSRVYSTEHVVSAIGRAKAPPRVLVQGSAIGYYGPHGDEELTEASGPGSDFMAVVCREWEEAAEAVAPPGVRLATVRTGIVLARGEGALGVMAPIFKWLPGGAAPVGSSGSPFKPATGQQWMSWIHLDDIVGIFLLALDRPEATGPINGTSPSPSRNHDFSKALARKLHRGLVFLPIGPPDMLLDLVLGGVARTVTKGQKVIPDRAIALGYRFKYTGLAAALDAVFARQDPPAPTPRPAAPAHAGHH